MSEKRQHEKNSLRDASPRSTHKVIVDIFLRLHCAKRVSRRWRRAHPEYIAAAFGIGPYIGIRPRSSCRMQLKLALSEAENSVVSVKCIFFVSNSKIVPQDVHFIMRDLVRVQLVTDSTRKSFKTRTNVPQGLRFSFRVKYPTELL